MRAEKVTAVKGPKGTIALTRTQEGVPCIEADSWEDVFFGQGWLHARDRFVDMNLLAIMGQGRASEKIRALPELLTLDTLFRKMNFWPLIQHEVEHRSEEDEPMYRNLWWYSQGINSFRERFFKPLEFFVAGVNPPRWKPAHSLLVAKVMGYFGLAQSQEDVERFIIEAIRRGTKSSLLKELFKPHLDGCDFDMIAQVFHHPLKPLVSRTPSRYLALVGGSNNWAVSPARSKTGSALFCNDPHLEINRLPPVWYENIIRCPEASLAGVSFPGVPGIFIGRNEHLSFGVTYAMADTTDFWIQDVKNGRYRDGRKWSDFDVRVETIKRKGKSSIKKTFCETLEAGVLEGEPLIDGSYLSLGWTGREEPTLPTFRRLFELNRARTVEEGLPLVAETAFPCLNWILADDQGSIGYQLGGSYPRRKKGWSGLYPIPGWIKANRWDGFLHPRELPSELNPKSGILATANNDTNQTKKPVVINVPLPPYRADRIKSLLKKKRKLTLQDMQGIQKDLYSLQAEKFMKKMDDFLDTTNNADYLRDWDCRYTTQSYAPTVFENVYRELILTVFGDGGLGRPWLTEILETSGLGEVLAFYFDRILLKKRSPWYGGNYHDELWQEAVTRALNRNVKTWGEVNSLTMTNMFFNGKLPRWLGFDAGPYALPGGRATPCQGVMFQHWGRKTTFAPSYRMVTDMSLSEIETNIPGGPSGRRFSPWYMAELPRFWQQLYKKVKLQD